MPIQTYCFLTFLRLVGTRVLSCTKDMACVYCKTNKMVTINHFYFIGNQSILKCPSNNTTHLYVIVMFEHEHDIPWMTWHVPCCDIANQTILLRKRIDFATSKQEYYSLQYYILRVHVWSCELPCVNGHGMGHTVILQTKQALISESSMTSVYMTEGFWPIFLIWGRPTPKMTLWAVVLVTMVFNAHDSIAI